MLSRIWIRAISALFACLHHGVAQANFTKVPKPPTDLITPQIMIVSMVSRYLAIYLQTDAYWLYSLALKRTFGTGISHPADWETCCLPTSRRLVSRCNTLMSTATWTSRFVR